MMDKIPQDELAEIFESYDVLRYIKMGCKQIIELAKKAESELVKSR